MLWAVATSQQQYHSSNHSCSTSTGPGSAAGSGCLCYYCFMNHLLCFIAAPVVFNLPKLWGIEQWRKSFQTALNCSKCTQSQLVMELMCVCFNRFGRIRGSQANGNYFTRYFYKDKEENSILVCLVLSYSGCVSQDGRKQWKHLR